MIIRAQLILASVLLTCTGAAAQNEQTSDNLQLNLDQFSEANTQAKNETLELNLEQFDNRSGTQESGSIAGENNDLQLNLEQFNTEQQDSKKNLELNLDQFEKADSTLEHNAGTEPTKVETHQYSFMRLLIAGGIMIVVLFFIIKRWRRK